MNQALAVWCRPALDHKKEQEENRNARSVSLNATSLVNPALSEEPHPLHVSMWGSCLIFLELRPPYHAASSAVHHLRREHCSIKVAAFELCSVPLVSSQRSQRSQPTECIFENGSMEAHFRESL